MHLYKFTMYSRHDLETLMLKLTIAASGGLLLTVLCVGFISAWWLLLAIPPSIFMVIVGVLSEWSFQDKSDDFDRGITLWLPWRSEPEYFLPKRYEKNVHKLHVAHRHEQKHCEQFKRLGKRGLGFYWEYMFIRSRVCLEAEAFAASVGYWEDQGLEKIWKNGRRYKPIDYYALRLTRDYGGTPYSLEEIKKKILSWT